MNTSLACANKILNRVLKAFENLPLKWICFLIFVSLIAFHARGAQPDFARIFQGKDGCFVLYDLKADKIACQYNPARCTLRVSPCSTFKVALAVMAFDKGILKDENTTYKWDGVDRGIPSWNRDTSAADWIRNSVVWFSQRITPQLGTQTVQAYLAKFNYGNQDITAGLTNFWLGSSLKISADEEIQFLSRLWRNQLPASNRSMALTRKIMHLETSPSGITLSGKTGSHVTENNRLGWFVGHIEGNGGEYLVAVNFSEENPPNEKVYPGMVAEGICKSILAELGLY